MTVILTAIGGFIAAVVPVLVSIRWSRTARLRRRIESDAALLEKITDEEARRHLTRLLRDGAEELLILESRVRYVHPASVVAWTFLAYGVLCFTIFFSQWRDAGGPEAGDPWWDTSAGFAYAAVGCFVVGVLILSWRLLNFVERRTFEPWAAERRLRKNEQRQEGGNSPTKTDDAAPSIDTHRAASPTDNDGAASPT